MLGRFCTSERSRANLGCLLASVAFLVLAYDRVHCQEDSSPHPWMSDAPGEFVRLIDKGNVSIQVDDELVRKSGKSAITIFRFALDFDYKFRSQWVESGARSGVWKAKITSWIDQPKVRPEHTICIPSKFNPKSPWQSALMKHEFDHVAISTDPRLIKIIQKVLERRKTWVEEFEQATMPRESEIRQRIEVEVGRTVKICETMIQAQYDELDKKSTDGMSSIENRQEFFLGMFSVQGLERCKFAFLADMRAFVSDRLSNDSTAKEVEEHYLYLSR